MEYMFPPLIYKDTYTRYEGISRISTKDYIDGISINYAMSEKNAL
jgi:hypothetical protein